MAKNKSDKYQYRIVEISVDPFVMNDFEHCSGLGSFINMYSYSDEFVELQEELKEELKRLIFTKLTEHQKEIVELYYMKGMKQEEIAKKLGKHQTTIHKSLNGNIDYANGKKRYGGALKKLRKLCDNDPEIQDILGKMEQLREREE